MLRKRGHRRIAKHLKYTSRISKNPLRIEKTLKTERSIRCQCRMVTNLKYSFRIRRMKRKKKFKNLSLLSERCTERDRVRENTNQSQQSWYICQESIENLERILRETLKRNEWMIARMTRERERERHSPPLRWAGRLKLPPKFQQQFSFFPSLSYPFPFVAPLSTYFYFSCSLLLFLFLFLLGFIMKNFFLLSFLFFSFVYSAAGRSFVFIESITIMN